MFCKERILFLLTKKDFTADELAKKTGRSISCVYRALKKLESLCLINRISKAHIKYKKVMTLTLFGFEDARNIFINLAQTGRP